MLTLVKKIKETQTKKFIVKESELFLKSPDFFYNFVITLKLLSKHISCVYAFYSYKI